MGPKLLAFRELLSSHLDFKAFAHGNRGSCGPSLLSISGPTAEIKSQNGNDENTSNFQRIAELQCDLPSTDPPS